MMYKPAVRIILKLFEFIGCIACLITKQLTDQEARRVALRNQKFSREWSLLNNVTWSREGNAFANVTYGGYTLITGLFLISRCINSSSRPTLTDRIFLVVGVLFFFALGSLVYASIEQIPPELFDNAIILGSLSFLVGLLFLIDLGDPSKRSTTSQTQTERPINNQTSTQTTEIKQLNIPTYLSSEMINIPLSSGNVGGVASGGMSSDNEEIPSNGNYFSGERVDVVQSKELPKSQQPIFTKIAKKTDKNYGAHPKTKVKKIMQRTDTRYEDNLNCTFPYMPYDNHSQPVSLSPQKNFRENLPRCSKSDFETSEEDNIDRPYTIKPGFVQQAARMWDRKARRETFTEERSTIV